MTYQLGIDLGTTYSAAAVRRPGGPAEIVPLSADTAFVPSVAFLGLDGSLLIGADAEQLARAEPGRVARQFKRRIGDGTPLLIGGVAMTAGEVAARFVAAAVGLVSARLRAAPSRVALTHPAGWGPHRLVSLRSALTARGLGDTLFVPEPQAAVLAHAAGARLDPGAAVAVYDLGGGSLDAAVVRMLAPDRFTILGRPEELGFLDFDEAVFEHVRSALVPAWDALDPSDPAVLAGVARLRRDCVTAKEALSADTDVRIPVSLPGIDTRVRLTRAEFEEAIRPAVDEAVEALERTIRSSGLAANELAAVLLTGGSSRTPLITQEISARLGRPVTVAPWGVLAVGAALAASERSSGPADAMPTAPIIVAPSWTPLPAPPAPPPAPLPLVPPPPVAGGGIRRHRLVAAVAASAVAAMLVAGGVALASRPGPAGAGTGPRTDLTTSTTELPAWEKGVVPTTTPVQPPPASAPPPSSRRTNPPPPPPPPPPPRGSAGTTTRTTAVTPTPTGTPTTSWPPAPTTSAPATTAPTTSKAGAP